LALHTETLLKKVNMNSIFVPLIIGGQIPAIPALELDGEAAKQLPESD